MSAPDSTPSASTSVMTWASLLAHWTAIAKASVALPPNAQGDRWRSAVPSIINLQAVTHALAELDRTSDRRERAVGQDKAELLIREHAAALHFLWRGEPLPSELGLMIDDARAALSATQRSGREWRLAGDEPTTFDHPADLAANLLELGFDGDAFVPAPGIAIMPGCPIAFARLDRGGEPHAPVRKAIERFIGHKHPTSIGPCFRQAYRQYDFGTGQIKRDLVVPEQSELAAGQPLLIPLVLQGRPQPIPMPPPPGAIDRVDEVPVEFAD